MKCKSLALNVFIFIAIQVLISQDALAQKFPFAIQVREASNVIERILPQYADQFVLKIIGTEDGKDVFEIEPLNNKILIKGSSGVSICSGFNYFLKNYCNAAYNWRCGNNLNIRGGLPKDFTKVRKVTPYSYRYMFNYCTFSYSMPFWDWEQWERMIDWMALNGINMPLAPLGQELIWQRVYKKHGLSEDELKDFFVGPAYNAFGRMGCIDGFGGPLPQSWIEHENRLQKKILERQRQLGMTPVLQGFTGHIPPALAKKNPGLKITNLSWIDFPETYLLDWTDSLFTSIGRDFIRELIKEYGTDHFYAIDQFIEMTPVSGDTAYLKNMGKTVYSSIAAADPDGKWVLQSWAFTYQDKFWTPARTKAYFDGVPDDRMIALELAGESWRQTGWHKHDGWYGKQWVWSVLQNFGDKVGMYGGLTQIAENLEKALSSPDKGKLSGMGLMMEGLDYNPVIFEFVTDQMWETDVQDLNKWKIKYLKSRYGNTDKDIIDGWEHLFNYYYTKIKYFEQNPINLRPKLIDEDIWPAEASVLGAKKLMEAAHELKDVDAFQFDIVNLLRQIFGQYAGHLLYEITNSYKQNDIKKFDGSVREFIHLSEKLEQLMSTREEFLFDKWIADSRERATNSKEEQLYEWNAKAIITKWGGNVLYGYALKDWAGLYSSYYLPRWKKLFNEMRIEISGGDKLDYDKFTKDILIWEDRWIEQREENIFPRPSGNSYEVAVELWENYGKDLQKHQ